MPARAAATRGRARRSGGTLQWIALLAAAGTIMGLTFALGILVGRQWSRPAASTVAPESNGPRKSLLPARRNGLAGPDVEAPQLDQKQLTFYQTLTAPLGRGSADASQRREDKLKPPAVEPARSETPPPYPYASRGETIVEKPAASEATADARAVRPPADTTWAVQAAAFKTQAQADQLQKQLKQSGLDAYVVSVKGDDGQTTYRVRIGSFKSKADAQRVADRVRGERSLSAFITPK